MSIQPDKHPLRILLVENHADTRKYMAMYLQGLGHEVTTAASMREALAAAPGSDCNVLLSDIGLADGDGWELLRKARFPQPVYAIAMSGFGARADEDKSREAGYRAHLLKPISVEQLEEAIEKASCAIAS